MIARRHRHASAQSTCIAADVISNTLFAHIETRDGISSRQRFDYASEVWWLIQGNALFHAAHTSGGTSLNR